ncbi:MAG: IS66 family insertion sequence element accessory protein TnpB [Desulfobacterales bacterium]|nr:IS66 family insertion sequence element accessory protein TnpB [Desulfobacterales bacterium]
MITVSPTAKIFLAVESVDFRNGINGLGKICRQKLKQDPMKGAFFAFRNRSKTTIKILIYDGESFWLVIRRLSRGKIKWWPTTLSSPGTITPKEFQILLLNGNPEPAEFGDDWKKLTD